MTGVRYRFGRFRLDPAARELREGGELVALPARAFDSLVWLVEHRDRAVGRDELIAAVWGRAEVSDALLAHTIVKLRRTLGDSGSDQVLIRTVPRFGYRWVGEIEEEGADAVAPTPYEIVWAGADAPRSGDTRVGAGSARGLARSLRHPAALVLAVVVLLAAIAAGWHWRPREVGDAQHAAQPIGGSATRDDRAAAAQGANTTGADPLAAAGGSAAPAMVLPAEVDAPPDWAWLRMGVMDLVAHRLRAGRLRTMPSENVVGVVRRAAAASGEAMLRDPRLVPIATLRILPRVQQDDGGWTVRLDAVGVQRSARVEARADNVIAAAREAADALLARFGHARATDPAAAERSPALDELLQRTGAAMLADQLDAARALIDAAPPELQREPRIEQRLAQIELRAGDYAAVEARVLALLDRLGAPRDAALRARALVTLAAARVREDRIDEAAEAYEEAIALRKDADDPELLGIAHLGRGIVLAQRSRIDEASAELGVARIALQGIGDALGVAQVDVNLGDFELLRHRPAEALPMLERAVAQFQSLGAREGYAYALTSQVRAQRELLDAAGALATTQRFWPPEEHTSNERLREALRLSRAEVLVDLGRLEAAAALVAQARAAAAVDPAGALVARCDALAARIAWRRDDAAAAARHAQAALTPALASGDPILHVRTELLHICALRADGQGAAANAATARLGDRENAGDPWGGIYVDLAVAGRLWKEGQRDAALQRYADASRIAVESGSPEDRVAVGTLRVAALVAADQLDQARIVAGRIAPWADRDLRAALSQARLFRALGQDDAARAAREVARRLAGEAALADTDGVAMPW
jgi:DNA-binding winged helix-turn-helix (wHTH) protein/tetratricopeptide (TPR) repeat protein